MLIGSNEILFIFLQNMRNIFCEHLENTKKSKFTITLSNITLSCMPSAFYYIAFSFFFNSACIDF